MGHGGQADQADGRDLLRLSGADLECAAVLHRIRRRGDLRLRPLEQVGGREHLGVVVRVLRVVRHLLRRPLVQDELTAARAEHPPVRKKHRGGVIAAVCLFRRQHRPLPGLRVPQLRDVHGLARVEIVEGLRGTGCPAAACTSGYQHRPVREDGAVVLPAGEVHGIGCRPGKLRLAQIDGLRVRGRRVAAADEKNLVHVVQNRRGIVAQPVGLQDVRERGPRAPAGDVQGPGLDERGHVDDAGGSDVHAREEVKSRARNRRDAGEIPVAPDLGYHDC